MERFSKVFSEVRGLRSRGFQSQVESGRAKRGRHNPGVSPNYEVTCTDSQ